jgi:3-(3-hydroxy-phenyl)propionate hydroxylase
LLECSLNISEEPVLIIGGGPVGLTLAWRLLQAGVSVLVFEAECEIPDQLRASTFHPPTLDMFEASGIAAEIIAKGRITPDWQIRMLTTGENARFDLSVLKDDTGHPYRLQCRQAELSRALLARLPDEVVRFGSEVSAVSQDASGVLAVVNEQEVRGSIMVGCDGARSIVRKSIGAEFEGGTYPENTILATTHFPFEDHIEDLSGVNYIWKPKGTFSLLRLPDVWRVSLHPEDGQSPEEAMDDACIRAQVKSVIPAAQNIDIDEKRIYRVHRRVATHYRKNRMFLAGDAAHLNSPKGGMGMNGGIHDAWSLADKLIAMVGGDDPMILDSYERQRRAVAHDDIVQQADTNRARMNTLDPIERAAHLKNLQDIAADPVKARAFLRKSSMIDGLEHAAAIV